MLQIPTYLEQEHKRVKSTDTYLEHEQSRIRTHIPAFFKKMTKQTSQVGMVTLIVIQCNA